MKTLTVKTNLENFKNIDHIRKSLLPTTHVGFKLEAKRLAKFENIGPAKAHEVLARRYGFKSHNAVIAYYKNATY